MKTLPVVKCWSFPCQKEIFLTVVLYCQYIYFFFYFTDTCYTDFTKLTGNILSLQYKILTTRDCAFQCQINSGQYVIKKNIFYRCPCFENGQLTLQTTDIKNFFFNFSVCCLQLRQDASELFSAERSWSQTRKCTLCHRSELLWQPARLALNPQENTLFVTGPNYCGNLQGYLLSRVYTPLIHYFSALW